MAALPHNSLLSALRENTHDLHVRLETRLDITARFTTVDRYLALLERLYGFYLPLEEMLASPEVTHAWAEMGVVFEDRRKTDLLECDLRHLGADTTTLAGLKQCPADLIPSLTSTEELIGCAYVIEGATLGGQVIGLLLNKALNLRPGGPGARFFYGYGEQTPTMWRQFGSCAAELSKRRESDTPGAPALIEQRAAAAARRTLLGMEAWLVSEGLPELGEKHL